MINPIFMLPPIEFIGGTHKKIQIMLRSNVGTPYDAEGHTAYFSLAHYENQSCVSITQEMEIAQSGMDGYCLAEVELSSTDTAELCGRFVYQVTIIDEDGEAEVSQGICHIFRNITPSVLMA